MDRLVVLSDIYPVREYGSWIVGSDSDVILAELFQACESRGVFDLYLFVAVNDGVGDAVVVIVAVVEFSGKLDGRAGRSSLNHAGVVPVD